VVGARHRICSMCILAAFSMLCIWGITAAGFPAAPGCLFAALVPPETGRAGKRLSCGGLQLLPVLSVHSGSFQHDFHLVNHRRGFLPAPGWLSAALSVPAAQQSRRRRAC
jgi:hypothetical protein